MFGSAALPICWIITLVTSMTLMAIPIIIIYNMRLCRAGFQKHTVIQSSQDLQELGLQDEAVRVR